MRERKRREIDHLVGERGNEEEEEALAKPSHWFRLNQKQTINQALSYRAEQSGSFHGRGSKARGSRRPEVGGASLLGSLCCGFALHLAHQFKSPLALQPTSYLCSLDNDDEDVEEKEE